MNWGGRCVRDRRVEFVIRASRGEPVSALCREYEISRPTGYLWLRRFHQEGVAGIEERGRMTFSTIIETMAGHDLNHIQQLQRLI